MCVYGNLIFPRFRSEGDHHINDETLDVEVNDRSQFDEISIRIFLLLTGPKYGYPRPWSVCRGSSNAMRCGQHCPSATEAEILGLL